MTRVLFHPPSVEAKYTLSYSTIFKFVTVLIVQSATALMFSFSYTNKQTNESK